MSGALVAERQASVPGVRRRERRRWARTTPQLASQEAHAHHDWDNLVEPTARRLDHQITQARRQVARL